MDGDYDDKFSLEETKQFDYVSRLKIARDSLVKVFKETLKNKISKNNEEFEDFLKYLSKGLGKNDIDQILRGSIDEFSLEPELHDQFVEEVTNSIIDELQRHVSKRNQGSQNDTFSSYESYEFNLRDIIENNWIRALIRNYEDQAKFYGATSSQIAYGNGSIIGKN